MQLDQLLHQRQADAQARAAGARLVVALHEEIEHRIELARLDADAVIAHAQHGVLALACERHHDATSLRRVARGVVQDVGHNLHEPYLVALDLEVAAGLHYELVALA